MLTWEKDRPIGPMAGGGLYDEMEWGEGVQKFDSDHGLLGEGLGKGDWEKRKRTMTQTVRSGFGAAGIVALLALAGIVLALFPQAASAVCTEGTCTEVFNTSGTFTAPAGVTSVTVEAWGGGGSGGWREDEPSGGGGGGAYASGDVSVTPGANYTVTAGAGGVATTGSSGSVQNGGDSSFTGDASQQVLAKGGTAGAGTGSSGAGGAGGSATTSIGIVKFSGGNGGNAGGNAGGGGGGSATEVANGGNGANGVSNTGGTGGIGAGNGGKGGNDKQNGSDGTAPGGGGGGKGKGKTTDGVTHIGSGANGRVIITWEEPPPPSTSYYRYAHALQNCRGRRCGCG